MGWNAAVDATLMMAPRPRLIMPGTTARASWVSATMFSSFSWSMRSGSASAKSPMVAKPALLIR